jgi:hypothetical protein
MKLTACLSIIVSSLLLNVAMPATAQDLQNPGEYMTAVDKARGDMDNKYMQYLSAAAHGRGARKVEKLRLQVLDNITQSRYKTIEIPRYKGDNSLRQSAIDYIQLCYRVFDEDYKKIVNLEELAEQSFDEMQAYLLLQEKVGEKLREASGKLQKAAMDFAAKYNVQVTEQKSALGSKMEVAGTLNHYTNQVYLLFFKCNWQDQEIVKAMNNKKVNDIEQARSSLLRFANEGLQVLDTAKPFNGDPTLVNACREAIKYYKKSAEQDFPKLTDFYLKEENFNKIKKSYETKSNPTKADVDAYNKAVKDINDAVNSFNQTNNTINNGRRQAVNNWQNAEKKFADTHMPYYRG